MRQQNMCLPLNNRWQTQRERFSDVGPFAQMPPGPGPGHQQRGAERVRAHSTHWGSWCSACTALGQALRDKADRGTVPALDSHREPHFVRWVPCVRYRWARPDWGQDKQGGTCWKGEEGSQLHQSQPTMIS